MRLLGLGVPAILVVPPVALKVGDATCVVLGAIAVPLLMAPPDGVRPAVGEVALVVLGPDKLKLEPVVFVTSTPRITMYLPLYLDGLLAKSAMSTTN